MSERKGGDTRAKAAANGKRVGRPRKAVFVVPGKTTDTVAAEVLALNGRPDHKRRCVCEICAGRLKQKCECTTLDSDKGEGKLKIECLWCRTREDHKICRCQVCAWWDLLTARDQRIVLDGRKYLTDKSEGKAVQPVITEQNKPTEINVTIRRIGS